MEKEQYNVNESPDYNGHAHASYVDPATGIETKAGRIEEAAGLYGNIETAEQYGYVTRGYVLRKLHYWMYFNTYHSIASSRDTSNSSPSVELLVPVSSSVLAVLSHVLALFPSCLGIPSLVLPSSP
jgi:hypothetical protein